MWTSAGTDAPSPVPPGLRRRSRWGDQLFWLGMALLAAMAASTVLLIAWLLLSESLPLILKGGAWRFLSDPGWWPREGSFNMAPMALASLLLTVGALTLAAPFGIAYAIHTVFNAGPRQAVLLGGLAEASAAVPTVVYGLWGITAVVPLLGQVNPPGASLAAGIVVVAVMIFPTLTLLVQAALRAVPAHYAHSAEALGVSRGQVILRIILPAARKGVLSAMVLAAARAIGETMVVLMVCGNIVQVPGSVFEPVRTLTANIALEMPYAMGDHRMSLFVAGLLMLVLIAVMVMLGGALARGRRHT